MILLLFWFGLGFLVFSLGEGGLLFWFWFWFVFKITSVGKDVEKLELLCSW